MFFTLSSLIEPIRHDLRPDRAAPLVNWLVYHQAFLLEQALGPDALLAVQPGRLRMEPYQLVPVLRAIRMSRVRLLLCDGVGLGKTCQAGLVNTELIARRLAHRILIVSPAGPLLDVQLGGKTVAQYTNLQLAAGVNLAAAALKAGPVADQVQAIWKAIKEKNQFNHDQIYRGLILNNSTDKAKIESLCARSQRRMLKSKRLRVIAPHTVEILPAK